MNFGLRIGSAANLVVAGVDISVANGSIVHSNADHRRIHPVTAQYRLAKGDPQDPDDMKDEICLKAQVLRALQLCIEGSGAWKVTDVFLADKPPAHWIDSPKPRLSVQKPKPNAIVAFCGTDEKTASGPTVLAVAPDDKYEIHIVIFEPATQ